MTLRVASLSASSSRSSRPWSPQRCPFLNEPSNTPWTSNQSTTSRYEAALLTMIIVNIDVMLARRKMSVTELADKVGITIANLSILKNGKARAIRFSTLEALCKALECQPGDILEYRNDEISTRS